MHECVKIKKLILPTANNRSRSINNVYCVRVFSCFSIASIVLDLSFDLSDPEDDLHGFGRCSSVGGGNKKKKSADIGSCNVVHV